MRSSISIGIQINENNFKPLVKQTGTQTKSAIDNTEKSTVSVMCRPEQRDVATLYAPQLRTVGVSDHTTLDSICNKCNINKNSVGIGPDQTNTGLSLKNLDQRSSSFSLGENEKLKLRRKHVSVQCSSMTSHAATQHSPLFTSKQIQHSPETFTQYTDTKGLVELKNNYTITDHRTNKHKDSFTNTDIVRTREYGTHAKFQEKRIDHSTNTDIVQRKDTGCGDTLPRSHIQIICADNYCDSCKDSIKSLASKFTESKGTSTTPSSAEVETKSKPSSLPTESKIPKLSISTPSPTGQRKFVRQNTYTVESPSVEKSFIPFERKTTFTVKTTEPSKEPFVNIVR